MKQQTLTIQLVTKLIVIFLFCRCENRHEQEFIANFPCNPGKEIVHDQTDFGKVSTTIYFCIDGMDSEIVSFGIAFTESIPLENTVQIADYIERTIAANVRSLEGKELVKKDSVFNSYDSVYLKMTFDNGSMFREAFYLYRKNRLYIIQTLYSIEKKEMIDIQNFYKSFEI